MYLLNKRRIVKYQFYLILIIFLSCFFFLIVTNLSLNWIDGNPNLRSTEPPEESSNDPSRLIIGIFVILGILISVVAIVGDYVLFWTPSLVNTSSLTNEGKMFWSKRVIIPERKFQLRINNIKIVIQRKLSSLDGLLMREFIYTVYLPRDTPESQIILNFFNQNQRQKTATQLILSKNVKWEYIPLQNRQIELLHRAIRK